MKKIIIYTVVCIYMFELLHFLKYSFGEIGVEVFIIMSGFLSAMNILLEHYDRSFYIRNNNF